MTAEKKPSLKGEWKNEMRWLDEKGADMKARAVYTALWSFTNTNDVNSGVVAAVWPKVSNIRDLIGVKSDKSVIAALDWLTSKGFIWRVAPPSRGKLHGRLVIRGKGLDRGVNCYALIHRATLLERAEWAHSTREAFGDDFDGGPTLAAALAINVQQVTQTVEDVRRMIVNGAVDDVLAGKVRMTAASQIIAAAIGEAWRSRLEKEPATAEAIKRLRAHDLAAQMEDIVAKAPHDATPKRTAKRAANG